LAAYGAADVDVAGLGQHGGGRSGGLRLAGAEEARTAVSSATKRVRRTPSLLTSCRGALNGFSCSAGKLAGPTVPPRSPHRRRRNRRAKPWRRGRAERGAHSDRARPHSALFVPGTRREYGKACPSASGSLSRKQQTGPASAERPHSTLGCPPVQTRRSIYQPAEGADPSRVPRPGRCAAPSRDRYRLPSPALPRETGPCARRRGTRAIPGSVPAPSDSAPCGTSMTEGSECSSLDDQHQARQSPNRRKVA
jgi:hypothetical protein